MLANAVSSAVERLYAAAPVGDARTQVSRVSAVSAIPRLKVVGQDEADREAQLLEERDRLQQRQALTRGVLAVFEATGPYTDALGTDAAGDATERGAADGSRSDPQLEEAILRFIHTMFRSLPAEAPDEAVTAMPATGRIGANGVSREALSARIEALARRLGDAAPPAAADAARRERADEDELKTDATAQAQAAQARTAQAEKAPADPPTTTARAGSAGDASLEKAFAEVVQALHGNLGALEQSPTTRAELVSMMQRLALAMHGSPPIDPGLPTRGGLLSARA